MRCLIFPKNRGVSALAEEFLQMNARETIRDAILVKKMIHWKLRSLHLFVDCPPWRAKKNYLFLVRKYKTLAGRHGLRETDVFS
jgi:hypothetical protein